MSKHLGSRVKITVRIDSALYHDLKDFSKNVYKCDMNTLITSILAFEADEIISNMTRKRVKFHSLKICRLFEMRSKKDV